MYGQRTKGTEAQTKVCPTPPTCCPSLAPPDPCYQWLPLTAVRAAWQQSSQPLLAGSALLRRAMLNQGSTQPAYASLPAAAAPQAADGRAALCCCMKAATAEDTAGHTRGLAALPPPCCWHSACCRRGVIAAQSHRKDTHTQPLLTDERAAA